MNSETITMDPETAARRLESYEQAMTSNAKRVTATDRAIVKALKVAAGGGRLIDVNQAIGRAGLSRAGLPLLAIARAHVNSVIWTATGRWNFAMKPRTWYPDGGGRFDYRKAGQRITDDRVIWNLPVGTLGDTAEPSHKTVRAFTPLIPLPLRPKTKLENFFVLWEANWHPEPPVDPYLLRPLSGSLMEIVAEWDVSPIELAAVRQATVI